jgi:hypothetical protein
VESQHDHDHEHIHLLRRSRATSRELSHHHPSDSSQTTSLETDTHGNEDDTDNASDSPQHHEDPQKKLTRLRLFSVVEILAYIYRSLLPIPLWGYYFAKGGAGSRLFTLLYFTIKVMDLSWKFKGGYEAIETFLGQKLVRKIMTSEFTV